MKNTQISSQQCVVHTPLVRGPQELSVGPRNQKYLHPYSHQSAMLRQLLSHAPLFVTPRTVTCQAPLSSGILQTRIRDCVAMPSFRGSSQPGDQTWVSCTSGDSLPSEPPGKPKHTRMCNLLLLQGNFLTQESNQGLLHCRQFLYQLSYLGIMMMAYEGVYF